MTKMKVCQWVVVLGVLLLFSQAAFAVPLLINYQGVLTDSLGTPVTNPTQAMTFKIYDSQVEGVLVWAESRTVDVQNGQYNLKLGEVTTLHPSIFDGGNLWLQVTVGGEILGDLQQLTTVPYAYFADTADYANFAYYVDGIVSGDGSGLTDVAADWSLLVNVPAGFADGVDNTASSIDGLDGGAISGSVAIGTTVDPNYLLTVQAVDKPIGASVETVNSASPESAGLVGRSIGEGGNYHYGLRGEATNAALANYGLYGQAQFQSVPSAFSYGAFGTATGANRNIGVGGEANDTNGERNYGLSGFASGGTYNFGVYGYAPVGTNNWAGYFDGDVNVAGKISGDGSNLSNVQATSIGVNAVGSAEIINGSITSADLGINSVGSSQVIDGSLTQADLGAGSVNSSEITAGAVDNAHLSGGIDPIKISGTAATLSIGTATQSFDNGTLAINGSNDTVAIGDATPDGTHKLEVVGDVGADSFKYRNSQIRYLNLPHTSFLTNGSDWYISPSYGWLQSSVNTYLLASINLPKESIVDNFTCYYVDNDINYDLNMGFGIYPKSNSQGEADIGVGYVVVNTTESLPAMSTVTSTSLNLPIDPEFNKYIMGVYFNPSGSSDKLRFYGCRIGYLVNAAD